MSWEYLQNPALQVRQILAAHFLRDYRHILEIGGYKTPVTNFLSHEFDELVVIDPLIESYEILGKQGRPCTIRHLPTDLDEFEIEPWLTKRFACVFCGMDINRTEKSPAEWVHTVCKFLLLLSHAEIAIIEYPVNWDPSTQLFNLVLSILQPRLAADIRIDLSRYPEEALNDEVRGRLVRRLVVLKNSDKIRKVADIRESVGRALLGSAAETVLSGKSKVTTRVVADGFDLQSYRQGFAKKAQVEFKGGVIITTSPDAWSYAGLIPFQPSVLRYLSTTRPIAAAIDVDLFVEAGEIDLGLISEDLRSISGERLVRAAPGRLQTVELFISDARGHVGLMCRNGQMSNTISEARVVKVELALARPLPTS